MPCFRPLSAWLQKPEQGKRTVVFSTEHKKNYDSAKSIDLPCGQCIGCRLERSRRWAVRLMHEAQLHERNSFLTLTYDDAHVPSDMSLKVEDFQLFMKRLRRGSSSPLRFFHCGEYGEQTFRPHYHCCLFGEDFSSDRELFSKNPSGDRVYVSQRLSEVWGKGFCTLGNLTFESAAYVARYCLKKITNKHDYTDKKGNFWPSKETHYGARTPEYVTMSRRPGIGARWFDSYHDEVYPSDSVVMRGKEMLPPPFYDKLLEKVDPQLFKQVKRDREANADKPSVQFNSSSRRLMDREIIKQQTINSTLERKL